MGALMTHVFTFIWNMIEYVRQRGTIEWDGNGPRVYLNSTAKGTRGRDYGDDLKWGWERTISDLLPTLMLSYATRNACVIHMSFVIACLKLELYFHPKNS